MEVLPGITESSWRILIVLLILLFTPILVKIFRVATKEALGRFSPALTSRVQAVGAWFIWGFMIVFAISQLYLDITMLLLIITLIGFALIIAARDFLSNVFIEQFLTTETFFKLGDWIQVGNYFGRVVKVDLTNTVLVTQNNEQVIIPNSIFSKEIVVNLTSKGGHRVRVPITVHRKYDLSKVERGLLKICDGMRGELFASKKPEVRVVKLNEDTVDLNVDLWILNPGKRDWVVSQFTKNAKEFLDQMGVE